MAKFPKPYFRKQRQVWAVQIGGRQISLGTDRKEAFAEYHRLMASEGRPVVASKVTAHELCDLFLDHVQRHKAAATYEWYKNFLQSFSDHQGRVEAKKVLPLHVSAWLDAHESWGQSTRRGAITAVKRCWAWATEEGRLAANPLAKIRRPKQTRRVGITEEGSAAILATMPPGPLRDFIDAMIATGCRPGELVSVESRTVDLKRSVMTVKGKAGVRDVVLTAQAAELIARMVKLHPEGKLFRNTRGNPWNRNSLRCALRVRRKKTGVGGAVPYAVRPRFE